MTSSLSALLSSAPMNDLEHGPGPKSFPINLKLDEVQVLALLAQNTVSLDGKLIANVDGREFGLRVMSRNESRNIVDVPIAHTAEKHCVTLAPSTDYAIIAETGPVLTDWQKLPTGVAQPVGNKILSRESRSIFGLARNTEGRVLKFIDDASWQQFSPLCDVQKQKVDDVTRARAPLVVTQPLQTPAAHVQHPHLFIVIFAGEETADAAYPNLTIVPMMQGKTTYHVGQLAGMMGGMGLHDLRNVPKVQRQTTDIQAKSPIAAFEVYFVAPAK